MNSTPDKPAREALIERLEKLAVYMDKSQHEKWCKLKSVPVHNYSGEAVLIRDAIAALRTPAEETCETCHGTGHEARHSLCRDCDDTTPPVDEAKVRVTDEMVMRAAHVFWTGANKDEVWLRSSPHATIRRALEVALSPAPAVDEKQGEGR